MSDDIATPKAVKSIQEAKQRLKNRNKQKMAENSRKFKLLAWLRGVK